MKILFILSMVYLSLSANDVQRLYEIVSDVNNVQTDNTELLEQKVKRLEKKVKELTLALKQKEAQSHVKQNIPKEPQVARKTKAVLKTKPKKKSSQVGTYRLLRDAYVYNEEDGEILYTWEKGRSFTSSKHTDRMIKVTGYFVNRIWRKAEKNMWVKSENAFRR